MRTITLALTLVFAGAGFHRAVRLLSAPSPVAFAWDFGEMRAQGFATVSVSLPGARRGELCVSSTPPEFSAGPFVTGCSIEANGAATVRVFNVGGVPSDPPNASFSVAIVR